VEECNLERQSLGPPERAVRLEADVAKMVVVELCQRIRQLVGARLVRGRGALRGDFRHVFEAEAGGSRRQKQRGGK
jgi:hypothetical protein